MKKPILIASAALVALAIPAIAAHHEGGHDGAHMMMPDMKRTDVEARIKEHFALVDANKDSAVTMDEINAYRDTKRKTRMDERFKMMDANGDGSISRPEFDAAHAQMRDRMEGSRHDMQGEGHQGGHHMMGMKMKLSGRMFEKADANKDGKVTLVEANSAALAHFDKMDADRNGTVTSQERMDYWKAKKDEWKDQKSSS